MNAQSILAWSFPIGRVAGISLRVNWTLVVWALFMMIETAQRETHGWMVAAAAGITFLSVLLHEFGHSFTARAVGGDSRLIVMWMFGGLAMCEVPSRWGARFIVAAAGPLVTLTLAATAVLILGDGLAPSYALAQARLGIAGELLWITAYVNGVLFAFNLLPCYPLDGGSMLRSLLWPLVGLRRAVLYTIYIAYPVLALVFVFALMAGNFFLGLLAVMLLFTVLQEHQAVKMGYEPFLGEPAAEQAYLHERRSWIARWRQRREQRRRAKERERAEWEERELDRLLAKVSANGLPSLTPQERKFLEQYSKQHRQAG